MFNIDCWGLGLRFNLWSVVIIKLDVSVTFEVDMEVGNQLDWLKSRGIVKEVGLLSS